MFDDHGRLLVALPGGESPGLGDHEVIEVVVADVFDDATSIAEVEAIAEANPGVDPLVSAPAQ